MANFMFQNDPGVKMGSKRGGCERRSYDDVFGTAEVGKDTGPNQTRYQAALRSVFFNGCLTSGSAAETLPRSKL